MAAHIRVQHYRFKLFMLNIENSSTLSFCWIKLCFENSVGGFFDMKAYSTFKITFDTLGIASLPSGCLIWSIISSCFAVLERSWVSKPLLD